MTGVQYGDGLSEFDAIASCEYWYPLSSSVADVDVLSKASSDMLGTEIDHVVHCSSPVCWFS